MSIQLLLVFLFLCLQVKILTTFLLLSSIAVYLINALYPLSTLYFVLCIVFVNAAGGGMYIYVYIS